MVARRWAVLPVLFFAFGSLCASAGAGEEPIVGFLYPEKSVTLCAKVTGQIVEFPFKVGDEVKAGQTVARMDDVIARLRLRHSRLVYESKVALERIDVQIRQTKSDIERQKAISGPKVNIERLTNQLAIYEIDRRNELERIQQRKLNVEVAQKTLADHSIVANVGGVIVEKFREEGESAEVPQPICTIAVVDRLVARIDIPVDDLPRVRKGMKLRVKVLVGDKPTVTGRVRLVGPRIDTASAMIPVEIEIPNEERKLIAGSRVEVVLPKKPVGKNS